MQLDGEGFCIRICAIRWLFTTYICIYVSMWELSLGNNILWVGENRRQRLGKGALFFWLQGTWKSASLIASSVTS